MEENQLPGKQDMVDRKAAWLERMFDRLWAAIQKDTKGFLNLVLIVYGVYITNLYVDSVKSSQEEIIKEVRRNVQVELPKQIAPIIAKQDSISKNVDSMSKNVDTSLFNLNGTLESAKEYIKKKTK